MIINVDCPFSAQGAGDISPASVVRLRVLALNYLAADAEGAI